MLPYVDLFLYDVKCFDSKKHKKYTGVGNELILSNLRELLRMGKDVWVRIPIIPTVNDAEKELRSIKEYLLSCGKPKKVELLPYHALGEHKYAALGRTAQIFSAPSEEKMTKLKKIFSYFCSFSDTPFGTVPTAERDNAQREMQQSKI